MQMLSTLSPPQQPQQIPVRGPQPTAVRDEAASSFQLILRQQTSKSTSLDQSPDSAAQEVATPDLVQQELAAALIAQGMALLPTDPLAASAVPADALVLPSGKQIPLWQSSSTESAVPAQSPTQSAEGSGAQSAIDTLIRSGLRPQPPAQASPAQAQAPGQNPEMIKSAFSQMSQPTAQLHQEMDGEIRVLSDANARPLFQQMEHAPVKVGEAPAANAESPHFEEALARPIQTALGEGAQTLEIKLTPSHLGSVTVSLTQNQDGTLHVVLLTMTDKAARLLSEHTGGLMHLLRAGTHSSVQIEVQQFEQGQQHGQEGQPHQGQQNPREQERRQQQERQHGADNFLQQLRLGLLPLAAEAV